MQGSPTVIAGGDTLSTCCHLEFATVGALCHRQMDQGRYMGSNGLADLTGHGDERRRGDVDTVLARRHPGNELREAPPCAAGVARRAVEVEQLEGKHAGGPEDLVAQGDGWHLAGPGRSIVPTVVPSTSGGAAGFGGARWRSACCNP